MCVCGGSCIQIRRGTENWNLDITLEVGDSYMTRDTIVQTCVSLIVSSSTIFSDNTLKLPDEELLNANANNKLKQSDLFRISRLRLKF